MNLHLANAMLSNEVRLNMRRTSTFVVTFVVIAIVWLMIVDPAGGKALLVVEKTRGAYNSVCLALGSSLLAGMLFPLGGFYLLRGRMREDIYCGTGKVLAATPISDGALIFWRWLGGAAYLCLFLGALILSLLALQKVRGEGPIEPLVFLQFHGLVILPAILFASSMAVLCDAHASLMGRRGDVLYFLLWMGQIALAQSLGENSYIGSGSPVLSVDLTGVGVLSQRAQEIFHTKQFNIGISGYEPGLIPLVLGAGYWTWEMVQARLGTAVLATAPLGLAIALFHRYSPDRVVVSDARRNWALLAFVNRRLHSFKLVSNALFGLAVSVNGRCGAVLAELALTLAINPLSLLVWGATLLSASLVDYNMLKAVLIFAILFWGTLISNLGGRDAEAGIHVMSGALPGGNDWRFLRQYLATMILGLLFTGAIMLRWLWHEPVRAAALASGIVLLASAAHLLVLLTRTARTFLATFFLTLYISMQAHTVAALDVVGLNGAATPISVMSQFVCALGALWLGRAYNRRRHSG